MDVSYSRLAPSRYRSTASLAKSILFFYIYIQTRVSKAKYTLTQ